MFQVSTCPDRLERGRIDGGYPQMLRAIDDSHLANPAECDLGVGVPCGTKHIDHSLFEKLQNPGRVMFTLLRHTVCACMARLDGGHLLFFHRFDRHSGPQPTCRGVQSLGRISLNKFRERATQRGTEGDA